MLFKAKEIYSVQYAKKYPDPYEFVNGVASNLEHEFWGTGGAGREFAREILAISRSWRWLSRNIDDYALFMENDMRKKLSDWIWKSHFEKSSLANHLTNTESAACWLMDRYVNELKNLFDIRYKNHIKRIHFTSYEEKKL